MTNPIDAPSVYWPLLRWFHHHRRDLPWRTEPREPYHVWLAEVMLQQTQVATVIPYYQRWLQRFPTLQSLADAPLDDVLKMWEGLGYYSRARNLHRAAQTIARELDGQIPATLEGLLKLPGIGRYTAGAIASLAFGRDAPILDGNVIRVLTRVFGIAEDVKQPATLSRLWHLSESLLPRGRAGQFNEALMDLGAMVCIPVAPRCLECPLSSVCTAYTKGSPEAYPVKQAKQRIPIRHFLTTVLMDPEEHLLLAQRPPHGLLGGLWEFPGLEIAPFNTTLPVSPSQVEHVVQTVSGLDIHATQQDFIGQVKHTFTHFQMVRHVALIRLASPTPPLQPSDQYTNMRWLTQPEIAALALTRSDQKILALLNDLPAQNPGLPFR
jgi:A/G-specific adenine glycosylase